MSEEKDSTGEPSERKQKAEAVSFRRAKILLIVVAIESLILFLLWITGVLGYFLAKFTAHNLHNVVAILIATPPAYLIWLWRDANRRDDIEVGRHDLRLKDFHKIEEWATIAPVSGGKITQIAAIHQLRPYLLGEMGKDFQRPTFEIYKALLDSWQLKEEEKDKGSYGIDVPAYIKAIHQIIAEEIGFFRKVPWKKKEQRGKSIYQENLLQELDLKYIDLEGKILVGLNLKCTTLKGADLQRADLPRATLEGSDLQHAILNNADLQDAYLWQADLQNADLQDANLLGACLSGIKYDDATRFSGAIYNSETEFHDCFDPEEHHMIEVDENGKVIKDEE